MKFYNKKETMILTNHHNPIKKNYVWGEAQTKL